MPDRLPYVVEPMTLADVERVMEIEQVAFSAPWSARAYRYEILENDNSTMLVVRSAAGSGWGLAHLARRLGLANSAAALGYGGFWLLVDDAHIATIAVDPVWRGRGLGSLLLLSLIEQGAERGAVRATLEVRVSNETAQGLYRSYGFEIVSRRRRYYADNDEDAYIMATPHFNSTGFQSNLAKRRAELYRRLRAEAVPHGHQNG